MNYSDSRNIRQNFLDSISQKLRGQYSIPLVQILGNTGYPIDEILLTAFGESGRGGY